jgi:hypothetical protein
MVEFESVGLILLLFCLWYGWFGMVGFGCVWLGMVSWVRVGWFGLYGFGFGLVRKCHIYIIGIWFGSKMSYINIIGMGPPGGNPAMILADRKPPS